MIKYKCEYCKDTGYIIIPQEHQQDIFKPCKCLETEKTMNAWRGTGISVSDIDKSFKNFEPWNIDIKNMKYKASNYYCRFNEVRYTKRNSILLCGNPGCGKTHLALALANNFINKKNIKVLYMPYRDVVTNIKQNMLDGEYYKRLLRKYQKAEILLIDDLLKGKVTDADINIMFEIINYRYLNRLPMIISTEFTVDKLLDFDEAIGSRIYEMCKDFTIEIQGKENNYRLR